MNRQRYIASPKLLSELAEQERSRRWLALKIRVSPTMLHYVISGERTIGAHKAELAAAVLGKDVSDLFVSISAEAA